MPEKGPSREMRVLIAVAIILGVSVLMGLGVGLMIRAAERDEHPDEVWAPEVTHPREDDESTTPTVPISDIFTPTPTVRGDDDGELHDGWRNEMGYTFKEGVYTQVGLERMDAYDRKMDVSMHVHYPVFEGAGEYTTSLNEAIRACAMDTVDTYYLNPDDDAKRIVGTALGDDVPSIFVTDGAEGNLSSDVSFAITYNTEDFISVSFSDSYVLGSYVYEFISLRCVNVNLKTGQIYRQDEVFTITDDIANAFVDALIANAGTDSNGDGTITEDECLSVNLIGREDWVRALKGEGDYASRVIPTFFVDEKGRVNLGVTYFLGNDKGIARGWWDVTLDESLLDGAKLESTFWDLL